MISYDEFEEDVNDDKNRSNNDVLELKYYSYNSFSLSLNESRSLSSWCKMSD